MLGARTLAWEQAKAEIEFVRPNLAYHLDELYRSGIAPSPLEVISVEYNYADPIIHEGKPVPPQGEAFAEKFIIENDLPLGIITKNSCEVTGAPNVGENKSPFADAILGPGDFVGLFEAVDRITGVRFAPAPHWNIVAGVCSIYAIPNLTTQQSRKLLQRAFGQHIGDLGIKDAPALIDQLKRMPPFHEIAQNWRVRIVYFSRSWIEALRGAEASHLSKGPFSTEQLKVTDNLLRRAWINAASVRDKDPRPLQQLLREAIRSNGNHGETADAAGLLLKRVGDVLAGRRPFYVPLSKNTTSGPFGDIATKILGHVTEQNWVLSPAQLSGATKTGYLKLEHLVPTIRAERGEGGIKDRVLELMNVLRLAVQNTMRAGERDRELMAYAELLNNIMFQTPSARGADRRPSFYMISFDPRRQSATPADFHADDFYAPQFPETRFPNERCAFFRSSVKIDGSKLREWAS